jgi:methyl-accepting chemotaxis protein
MQNLGEKPAMKISARFMYINVVIVAMAILCATLFSLMQIRSEATRQASMMQESHLKTFWELLRSKGKGFRVVEGKLLAGNYVLNGAYELPDRIKEIFGGTATIFMGDIRISTNVRTVDDSRAVGTRLQGPAYDAIFRKGKPYRGEALILGVPYLTAYDPIRGNNGEIIGALFVGIKKSEFFASYERLKINSMAMSATLIIILRCLLFCWSERGKRPNRFLRIASRD